MNRIFTLALVLLAFATGAWAQISAGEAKMNLNGTVSAGYNDTYSNFAPSDHSIIFGGSANLSGSYYDPGFLTFDVEPFYNQSRDNSTYQYITDASGVTANAHLFGGTRYGGSISYSSVFNGSGNYNLPGLPNYSTHGNNDTLSLSWGLHPQNLPSLNLAFSNTNSNFSIFGATPSGTLHSDIFSVSSTYRIAGFRLNGGDQYTHVNILTPEILAGESSQRSDSGVNSLFGSVSHSLPWKGSFSAAANRQNLSTDFGPVGASEHLDTTVDTFTGAVSFAPGSHMSVGASTFYTDNLEGTIFNTLVTAGSIVPQSGSQQVSHDLTVTGFANYELPAQHLHLNGFVEHQQQTFLGTSFGSYSSNGTASYINTVFGGSFSGVLGLTYTSIDTTNQSLLGVYSSFNYSHQIRRWTLAGGFGYSQGTQTVLIAYTTSGYNYNGSIGRRIGRRSYWGVYATGARSLLTGQPGTANASQSYSTSLSLGRYSFSGSYAQSSGNALLTATGLVSTTVPLPVINPASVVFFNGKSYSAGIGAHPLHGLTLTAIFAKALSTTNSNANNSNNNNEDINTLITYNVRKVSLLAGYSRLVQGFSITGAPPALVGSYYVGISRWFNFF